MLDELFRCLTAWLAPVLVFTTEEAWLTRYPDAAQRPSGAVPDDPGQLARPALGERWERIREVRRVVTGALELERKEKRIGSSLQAAPAVYLGEADRRLLAGLDLAELAITSGIELRSGPAPAEAFSLEDVPGVAVVPALAEGEKCAALLAGPARGDGFARASLPALHGGRGHAAGGLRRAAWQAACGRSRCWRWRSWHRIRSPNGRCWTTWIAYQPVTVTPFFNLVLVWNRGVSFGMFAGAGDHGPWLLTALAAAIGAFLLVWLYRETPAGDRARARGWCWPAPSATRSTGSASAPWWIFWTSTPSATIGRRSTWPTARSHRRLA